MEMATATATDSINLLMILVSKQILISFMKNHLMKIFGTSEQFVPSFHGKKIVQHQMVMEMATEMDTIINSQQTISQAMAITAITAITEIMASMAIQATDHKMISNQLHHTKIQATNTYLHKLIHLNHNRNHHGPTISTFHQHKINKINKIAQMAAATVISIHKADIDTEAGFRTTTIHVKNPKYQSNGCYGTFH